MRVKGEKEEVRREDKGVEVELLLLLDDVLPESPESLLNINLNISLIF